jgi:hypothetical protein
MFCDSIRAAKANTVIICVLLGFLAMAMGVAKVYVVHENTALSLPFPVEVFVYWVILLIIFFALDLLLLRFSSRVSRDVSERKRILSFVFKKADVLKIVGVIICCWLPYLILFYPGVLFSDTSGQLVMFFGGSDNSVYSNIYGAHVNDHHPVLDTLYLGAVVWLGQALTGSANFGLLLLCFVQAILLAVSIAMLCCYLHMRGLSRRFCLLMMFFFCLFPLFPYLAMSPTKDTIFVWVYIPFFIGYLEMIRTKGQMLRNKKMLVAAIVVCLLLVLTKKPGIYLLLFCGLVALIAFRAEFKTILAVLVVPLIVMQLIMPLLIFPALKISPGTKVEMLGPLYQQTARYVIDHPDDVTAEERAVLDELLGYDTLAERYNPLLVDPLHHDAAVEFWPDNSQIISYMQVYFEQGFRHPLSYLKATAALQSGWFNTDERYFIGYNYGMFTESVTGPDIVRPDAFIPPVKTVAQFFTWLGSQPVLGLFFMPALYTTFIPFFSFLLVWHHSCRCAKQNKVDHRRQYLLCFIPVAASLIFLYLSPVSINLEALRYSLPFLYTAPLLIGATITAYRSA